MSRKKGLYVRIDKEMEARFARIKDYFGLTNDTEAVRALIKWFWRTHEKELRPQLEHYNIDGNGVKILDREMGRVFQVYFKPDMAYCEFCETNACKHVEYALSLSEVQKILKEKGWTYRGG